MLRGYRGIILAFGLILCGAAPPDKERIGAEATGTEQPAPALAPKYAPYPDYNPDPCYQSKDHDTADLCAQWRAAMAAEKAADTAGWGNIIGGVGAALSFISLVFVYFALRQTERSLDAARNANEITQASAERQLRAYVMAEDGTITDFTVGGPTTFRLKIYNRGQTPAHDVRIWSIVTGAADDPDSTKIKKIMRDGFRQSREVLGPGNFIVHDNGCQGPMTEAVFLPVALGDLKMVFAGVITYRDVFDRRRFTTFKQFFVGNPKVHTSQSDLTACGRGNVAS